MMRMLAYKTIGESRDELRDADLVVMDEDAYRELGFISGKANVVISPDKQFHAPGCFVKQDVGGAVRIAIGNGSRWVVVVGRTIFNVAVVAYHAEMPENAVVI